MSLVCHECRIDLEPGKELPGREGALVHPVLLALKYVVLEDKNIAHKTDYMWSKSNRSLCFECIEKKLPEERKHLLDEIYDCYEAETEYRKIEDAEKGRWVAIDSTFTEAYTCFEKNTKKSQNNAFSAAKTQKQDCLTSGRRLLTELIQAKHQACAVHTNGQI